MDDYSLPTQFRMARLARNCSVHEKPMGAAIFNGHRIIGIGFNQNKTHPRFPDMWSLHAEIHAILSTRLDLTGATIYVYRELKNGMPGMAKPCPICQKMIISAGIRRAIYTVKDFPHFQEMEF